MQRKHKSIQRNRKTRLQLREEFICSMQSYVNDNTADISRIFSDWKTLLNEELIFIPDCPILTALTYAVSQRQTSLIIKLLQAGADPNAGTMKPLNEAIVTSQGIVVGLLLKNHLINKKINAPKVNVNAISANRRPLHVAAYNNETEILKLLLTDPTIDIHSKNPIFPMTALQFALMRNNVGCIQLLLERIALDIHPDIADLTIEQTDIVESILAGNGDDNIRINAAKFLLQTYSKATRNVPAKIETPVYKKLRSLIAHIIKFDIDEELLSLYLHLCNLKLHEVTVMDANHKDRSLLTIFSSDKNLAYRSNWLQFLIKREANVNEKYVLTNLIQDGSHEIVSLILSTGNVNERTCNTALRIALITNNRNIHGKLIEYGKLNNFELGIIEDSENYFTDSENIGSMWDALLYDDIDAFSTFFPELTHHTARIALKMSMHNKSNKCTRFLVEKLEILVDHDNEGSNLFMHHLYNAYPIDYVWRCLKKSYTSAELFAELGKCQRYMKEFLTSHPHDPACLKALGTIHELMVTVQPRLTNSVEQTESLARQGFFSDTIKRNKIIRGKSKYPGLSEVDASTIVVQAPPVVQTWFAGEKLDDACLLAIDNSNDYLLFLPNIDCHHDQVFVTLSRFHFSPFCIKALTDINLQITCSIHGVEEECEVTHELKSPKTDDRILLARLRSDQGGAYLYVAFEYLSGGLHTSAQIKSTIQSIKKLKAISLDFAKLMQTVSQPSVK